MKVALTRKIGIILIVHLIFPLLTRITGRQYLQLVYSSAGSQDIAEMG